MEFSTFSSDVNDHQLTNLAIAYINSLEKLRFDLKCGDVMDFGISAHIEEIAITPNALVFQ